MLIFVELRLQLPSYLGHCIHKISVISVFQTQNVDVIRSHWTSGYAIYWIITANNQKKFQNIFLALENCHVQHHSIVWFAWRFFSAIFNGNRCWIEFRVKRPKANCHEQFSPETNREREEKISHAHSAGNNILPPFSATKRSVEISRNGINMIINMLIVLL